MKDERHDNVVRFRRPPPKKPAPPPRKPPQAFRRPGAGGEPAINWSRAPKAIALIVIFFVVMWLVSNLGGLISSIGMR